MTNTQVIKITGQSSQSSVMDKAIAIGLIVIIVFTALAHGAVEEWSVAIFESMAVVLILLWAVKAAAERSLKVTVPTIALPLTALLILGLFQSISIKDSGGQLRSLSMDVESTREAVMVLFSLLACFMIAANFFVGRERLRALAGFLVVYGMALAVFALIQYLTWNGRFFWFRVTDVKGFGPFVNKNHFAGYMELLIPIPVALIVTRGVREARLLFGFAAAIMGVAAVVSLSRGGWVSVFVGLMFIAAMGVRFPEGGTAYHNQSKGTILVRIGAVGAILAAIIAGVIWIGADPIMERINPEQLPFAKARQVDESPGGREYIWRQTWNMIRAHPLLGVGFGAYQTAYPIYTHEDGLWVIDKAHNDYLQLLAECGIVGGVLALWFIVSIFRAVASGARSRDPLVAGLALASGAAILSMLVHSLVDFNLQIPSNALLFLTMSAVAASTSTSVAERNSEGPLHQTVQVSTAELATGVSS